MSRFLIHIYTGANPVSISTMCLIQAWSPSPSTSFAAQQWPLSAHIPRLPQGNAVAIAYLITRENLTPLQTSPSVFGIPASSQFNSFCRQAFLTSMPDRSLVTNYHCWAITVLISPSMQTAKWIWFCTCANFQAVCRNGYWLAQSETMSVTPLPADQILLPKYISLHCWSYWYRYNRGRGIYHLLSACRDPIFTSARLKSFFSSAFCTESIDFFPAHCCNAQGRSPRHHRSHIQETALQQLQSSLFFASCPSTPLFSSPPSVSRKWTHKKNQQLRHSTRTTAWTRAAQHTAWSELQGELETGQGVQVD